MIACTSSLCLHRRFRVRPLMFGMGTGMAQVFPRRVLIATNGTNAISIIEAAKVVNAVNVADGVCVLNGY